MCASRPSPKSARGMIGPFDVIDAGNGERAERQHHDEQILERLPQRADVDEQHQRESDQRRNRQNADVDSAWVGA